MNDMSRLVIRIIEKYGMSGLVGVIVAIILIIESILTPVKAILVGAACGICTHFILYLLKRIWKKIT